MADFLGRLVQVFPASWNNYVLLGFPLYYNANTKALFTYVLHLKSEVNRLYNFCVLFLRCTNLFSNTYYLS